MSIFNDAFTVAYAEAALWSSTYEQEYDDGTTLTEPMDSEFSFTDLAPETIARFHADCVKFQSDNTELLAEWFRTDEYNGHDFWLTRNRHGAGFWDRANYGDDEQKAIGDKLTEASHQFGETDLYIGDDGMVYAG